MTTLTPEDRARLRDLAAKATPGPWVKTNRDGQPYIHPPATGAIVVNYAPIEQRHADGCYIAAADPATVAALLDALDTAEAELATERQAASAAREVMDRHHCDEQAERAYRRAERAEAAVQRVRDLHTPRVEEAITGACADEECEHDGQCPGSPFTVCAECWRIAEETYRYFSENGIVPVLYPCQTVRALDGDDASRERSTITIPRPHVPYGPDGIDPDQADASYLREAARKLDEHYKPFGSNLRATVVKLISDAARALDGDA